MNSQSGMMKFEVNNRGVMTLQQISQDGPVHVDIVRGGKVDALFSVPAGEMVLLLDWFLYAKAHGLPLFPEQPQRIGGAKQ